MRFGSATPPTRFGLSSRERLRLWMLVIALGLVLAAMRHLRQPETIETLDRIFLGHSEPVAAERELPARLQSAGKADSARDQTRSSSGKTEGVADETSEGQLDSPPQSSDPSGDYSVIQDNTYFRSEERGAWFGTFERLQELTPEQLSVESVGEVTYAQLLQQPQEYRGRIVTLRGTVLREEVQQPEENSVGITRYHRLWLRPQGGGQWPFVVYCRQLPVEFPRGDSLGEDVSVMGVFFKNWSYPYDEGMGLAPVVLADKFEWIKPLPSTPRKTVSTRSWVWAATCAAVFSLAVVWIAVRRTARRPRSSGRLPVTFLPPDDLSAEHQNGSKP